MNILFVGIGNMGGAILKSIFQSRKKNNHNHTLYVAKKSEKTFENMREFGEFHLYEKKLLEKMDIIFIGVKPYQMKDAIKEHFYLEESSNIGLNPNQIIVSMAAGVTIEKLETLLGADKKIIRIMPNTPVLVGEGMTSLTPNANVTKEELSRVIMILDESSKCAVIPESKIHGFIGLAGSSPAFGYIFLEAMADAGVKAGLTREESYLFASQAMLGASKMVLESKSNPGALKDAVCSPGGTTIEGVCTLEEEGFRNAIIKAVTKTVEKSISMSKL